MANILLVEPDYRSKFPPLGLLRLSTYHKSKGDCVTFARGKVPALRDALWHRVYVSSLFTWELKRTVETVQFYAHSVASPEDIFVGGIGATLRPDYIRQHVQCRIVEGQIDRPGILDHDAPAIADCIPDYSLLASTDRKYLPANAYFCRATVGCVRRCKFCAVPKLEPKYGIIKDWRSQICRTKQQFGEQRDLVLLDNNVLACQDLDRIIADIRAEGFVPGASFKKRQRAVDFNQGIDARLVTKAIAKLLGSICLSPVRLAFDHDVVEPAYRRAVGMLADQGFEEFTNYVLFNYVDDPASLYRRLVVNLELSEKHRVRVTGFPMRYIPINEVTRGYISPRWRWRYLRGIQCVLLATHGMVSPNRVFFNAAFGSDMKEFFEILTMPDQYIIYRKHYKPQAREWRRLYRRLSENTRQDFIGALETIHRADDRKATIKQFPQFRDLLVHYYSSRALSACRPGGCRPPAQRPNRRDIAKRPRPLPQRVPRS